MAADGTISIEVALKGKDQLISDTDQANKILNDFGSQAGNKMDESIKDNTDKAKRTLDSFPKEVKTELIAKAQEAGVKGFSALLERLPKEKQVELLAKVEDGQVIDFKKIVGSVPKNVETTVKAKDEATESLKKVDVQAAETGDKFSHLKEIVAGSMAGGFIGNAISNGWQTLKEKIQEATAAGVEYDKQQDQMNAVWLTLTGNAQKGKAMVDMTNELSVKFGQDTDLVNELNQQFYHVFDNQPKTEALTSAFLTMGDAIGLSSDRIQQVGLDFTHTLSGSIVQLGDFNQLTDAFPMMAGAMLKYEQQVQHNSKLTMTDLRTQMSAGKISAQDATAVIEELGQKYSKASENLMQTIPGMTRVIRSRMPALMGDIYRPFMTAQNPVLGAISRWVQDKNTDAEFTKLGQSMTKGLDTITSAFSKAFNLPSGTKLLDVMMGKLSDGVTNLSNLIASHATQIKTFFTATAESGRALGKVSFLAFADSLRILQPLLDGIADFADKHPKLFGDLAAGIIAYKTATNMLPVKGFIDLIIGDGAGKIGLLSKAVSLIKKLGDEIKGTNSLPQTDNNSPISGNGNSSNDIPSFGGGKSDGGRRGKTVSIPEESETEAEQYASRAERMASEAKPKQSIISRLMSIFTRNKSAVEESGTFAKDTEEISNGAKVAGRFGGALKAVAGLGTAITAADGIYQLSVAKSRERSTVAGGVVGGGVGGIAGGALAGAAVGTFAGPVGTAVGAGIGALAGSALGEKIGKSLGGSKIGKKLGMDMQNGVESAFHPKLDDGISKTTNKLKGGVKTFAKSYQDDMNKISGDTILLGSATGKQADKIEADMTKAYDHMSKSVDAYYKNKESKSKKDLETLVSQGYITQKEADKSLAEEKKRDASRAKNMKGAYANMQKETESYFKERASLTAKWEKKASDSAKEVEKERAVTRVALVAQGATKAQLAEFDAGTAKQVARARQKAKEGENKSLENLQKNHLKNMKSLQSQADADTYQDLKENGRKENSLLQKLSESKQKLSQKELATVVSNSFKQTQSVIDDANKTYNEVKGAAEKKYKATTSAAETEYKVNHSISKSQYDAIVSNAKHQRDDTISAAKTQRDTTVQHAKEQHKEVVDQATKQAGEHKSAVNTETGDVKGIWDRFLDNVAGVWNHLIDAWNWVGKLWGKKPSGHWKRYAAGTGGTLEDQMAVVGEEGFELAHHPSMGIFPVGLHGMETTFLPAGTSILPHNKSEEFLKLTSALPHHADGVFGTISDIFDKVKKAAGTIGSSIANAFGSAAKFIGKGVTGAWDWIKDHVGFDRVTKNDGQKWSSMRSDYGSNAVKSIAKGFKDTFSSLFKKAKDDQDSGGSGPLKSLPELESIARHAAEIMGVSPSDQFIKQLANVAMSESGGNSGAANLTDSNAKAGMASVGLLQYIPSTWSYYNVPGHNNRSSVLDNFVHFFNNSDWRNSIGYVTYPSWGGMYKWDWKHDGPQGAPRMAMGGRYTKETPAVIAEDGTEYVVNITKSNADELLAAAIEERAQTHPESIFAKALQNQMEGQSSVAISNGIGTLPSGIVGSSGNTSSELPDQINKSNALLRYIIQVIKEQGQQKSGSLVANSNQMIHAIETAINRAGHQTLYSATRTGGR
ncbi:tape measure protein [Schleiferilactobacillus harbinensis]|uniref:tape measure protein n=1 Tax=Schleiferilactobacillus harbinensis TaxID=304207 RepID=UPI0021A41DE2|nr:tape measure protein [Schleiferilactobacillus harbinensis]